MNKLNLLLVICVTSSAVAKETIIYEIQPNGEYVRKYAVQNKRDPIIYEIKPNGEYVRKYAIEQKQEPLIYEIQPNGEYVRKFSIDQKTAPGIDLQQENTSPFSEEDTLMGSWPE